MNKKARVKWLNKLIHEEPAALYYIAAILLLITPPILYDIVAWVMK